MIPVIRSSMPPLEAYIETIKPLWESAWLTNHGELAQKFEEQLQSCLKVENALTVVNGHQALEIALQGLGLQGEVITTPFTFISTTSAIVRSGLRPVFCDIRPDDYTIDADKIEALITDKTSAIMPVHVYGCPCDVEKIERIAEKHGLKVIYDAAHAFGVKIGDRGIGSFGDVSMFSMHATKVFHSIEGGLLTFKDDALKNHFWKMQNFGISGPETVEMFGTNAKMNEFQAAMGLCNLKYLDSQIEKRGAVFNTYTHRLRDHEALKLPVIPEGATPNYAYYPVVLDEEAAGMTRDEFCTALYDRGIMTRKYFYPLTNSIDCCKDRFDVQETPVAADISRRVLTLPLYADMTETDTDMVCSAVCEVLQQS